MKPSMNTTKYLSFHLFSGGQKMFQHLVLFGQLILAWLTKLNQDSLLFVQLSSYSYFVKADRCKASSFCTYVF